MVQGAAAVVRLRLIAGGESRDSGVEECDQEQRDHRVQLERGEHVQELHGERV